MKLETENKAMDKANGERRWGLELHYHYHSARRQQIRNKDCRSRMGNKHSIGFGYRKLNPTTDYDYDHDEALQHQQPLLLPDNREMGKLMMKKNAQLEKKLKDMTTTIDQLKASVAASSHKSNHKEGMAKLEKKNADLEKKIVVMAADIEKLKASSSNFSKKEDVEKLMKKNAKLEKQVAETIITPLKSPAAATNSDNKNNMIIVAGRNSAVGQITTVDPFITFNDDLVLPEPQQKPQSEDTERSDIFGCLILIVFLICVLIGICLPN